MGNQALLQSFCSGFSHSSSLFSGSGRGDRSGISQPQMSTQPAARQSCQCMAIASPQLLTLCHLLRGKNFGPNFRKGAKFLRKPFFGISAICCLMASAARSSGSSSGGASSSPLPDSLDESFSQHQQQMVAGSKAIATRVLSKQGCTRVHHILALWGSVCHL